jgi:two-component system sensor histidine kinase PhoQ
LFVLSFAVSWETSSESYRRFVFRVAESHQDYDSQVNQFRRTLWVWLLAAGFLLLLAQGSILRWSLRPLRRVAREIAEIESGTRDRLTEGYPRELRPLTGNLNAFIHESHSRLERHRNALADLAHSLKTPLAVLRSTVEGGSSRQEMQSVVEEQVARMNGTVEYQLQRAAASGRSAMAAPVRVAPLIQKVAASLAKVYATRGLQFEVRIDETLYFHGDEGDLMEIVGNLADNACKWARRRVGIQAEAQTAPGADFILDIEDDGPGIPAEKRSAILARGGRADPTIEGHGIGMAVVRNLVEEVYQGTLDIDTGRLGGAWIRVCLRF